MNATDGERIMLDAASEASPIRIAPVGDACIGHVVQMVTGERAHENHQR
jgi:hypothetical protein